MSKTLIAKSGSLVKADGELLQGLASTPAGVEDVQLNGTSIVTDGVANIPIADANHLGVAKIDRFFGIELSDTKKIATSRASASDIAAHSNQYKPIVPSNLVPAVDSVLCSTNPNELLTSEQQAAARTRLGIANGGEKQWSLKGTIVETEQLTAQKTYPVDMTGCTELLVTGTIKATATMTLASNIGTIFTNLAGTTEQRFLAHYVDTPVGMASVTTCKGNTSQAFLGMVSNGGGWSNGHFVAEITYIKLFKETTSCNISIYAR